MLLCASIGTGATREWGRLCSQPFTRPLCSIQEEKEERFTGNAIELAPPSASVMKAVDAATVAAPDDQTVLPTEHADLPTQNFTGPKDANDSFTSTDEEDLEADEAEPAINGIKRIAVNPLEDGVDVFQYKGKHLLVNGEGTHRAVNGGDVERELVLANGISKNAKTEENLKIANGESSKISDHTKFNGDVSRKVHSSLATIPSDSRKKTNTPKDVYDHKMNGLSNGSGDKHKSHPEIVCERLIDSRLINGNATKENTASNTPHSSSQQDNDRKIKHNFISQKLLDAGNVVSKVANGIDKDNSVTIRSVTPSVNGGNTVNGVASPDNNSKHEPEVYINGFAKKTHKPDMNGYSENEGKHIEGGDVVDDARPDSPTANWDRAVAEVKEQAIARLQEELQKAHQELKLMDEEVSRLSRIREEVEGELEDLTASLFQEAHNMVRAANVKQAAAERSLKESQMQVEVLTAEVAALKTLVLTSTPSRPNPHLHPQIDPRASRSKDDANATGVALFNKKHRRSPSHFNLKYGRENSPPESPVKEQRVPPQEPIESKDGWEVDPCIHKEFVSWKQNPKFEKSDPFIARVYNEDINLCLEFPNIELSQKVQEAVEKGTIFIEAVSDKSKTIFPKKCALLETARQCHYRMKLGDQEQWHYISQICRNRVIAVCDFLNYLRYIERGLVKSSVHDVYWEITRLRKEMVLARLGLALTS